MAPTLLGSAVVVAIARDVFFGKRVTDLYFDNFGWNSSVAANAVSRSAFDEDVLSVAVVFGFIIECHGGNASDDHPVLISLLVAL